MLYNMTLGAVVCTGYHGSGIAFGAVEDYVREPDVGLVESVFEIFALSYIWVTTLTFWGHVTSSVM